MQLEKTSRVQKPPSERMCTKKNTETTKRRHAGQNTKHTCVHKNTLPLEAHNPLCPTKKDRRDVEEMDVFKWKERFCLSQNVLFFDKQ